MERLSRRLKARREDALALLGLVALPMLVFSRALLGPQVFWQRDIGFYWYPQVGALVRVVAGGAWPLWNPYFSFGLPLLADPSSQILYPFTWANLLLQPAVYYKAYVLCHVVAAGIGVFLLMRSWKFGRMPSFVSGAVWVLSGPLLVVVSHTHHLAGTAWLPWVLLALDVALRSGSARASFGLGAVAAGQVLAGSGDLCLMSAFVALGYLLVFITAGGDGGVGRRLGRSLSVAALAVPAACLLSAPQWLPTLAILGSGQRLHLDPSINMGWSLHPASLIDLFVPRLVSDLPLSESARAALFESREPLFGCIYLGAGGAALVASSLALPWNRFGKFSAAGLLVSVLASLGRNTPLYPAVLSVTPLHLFRYPSKYVILGGLFWAILVGHAAEASLGHPVSGHRWRRRIGLGLAAAFAAALLVGSLATARGPQMLLKATSADGPERARMLNASAAKAAQAGAVAALVATLAWLRTRRTRGRSVSLALVTLVLADLFVVGRSINTLAPPELLNARPALLSHTRPGARVWVSTKGAVDAARGQPRGSAGWGHEWSWAWATNELLRPPTGARWGMRGSYDGDFTGLAPPLLSNLTLIMHHADRSPLGVRLLQMGGVDYVLSLDEWPLLSPVAERPSVFARPIRLYRVPGALASAYVVGGSRVAAEPESVETIADPTFDPTREVIVPPGASALRRDDAFRGSLRELWRRADSLGLEVETTGPAYTVVLEAFETGWKARVDGRSAPIVPANVLFQAVAVPGGKHLVSLEYRPASVVWGMALAGIGLSLGLVVVRVAPRRPADHLVRGSQQR